MVWDPSIEDDREQLEPVYYDVPAHLKHELWSWTDDHLRTPTRGHGSQPVEILANALRMDMTSLNNGSLRGTLETIKTRCQQPNFQLQAVRLLLKHIPNESKASELERRLQRGNSGYAVTADLQGLEFRVPPAAREEAEHAVGEVTEAVSQLLTKAWNAAYGIEARPDDAFQSAFKATEAALRPVVTPDDPNTSLFKLIEIFDAKPSKWELVIKESRPTFDPDRHTRLDGAQTVMQMARTVSYGQKARHGQNEDANSVSEARMAVHLAIGIALAVHEQAFRRV